VSQVTRDQGRRPKWVGYLTGAINVDSVLKHLIFRENRASLVNSVKIIAYGVVRFHHVEI
jgi:hypothetical protein